jgi:cell division transport system permease protein
MAILVVVSVVIVMNTIRTAVYHRRKEIEVMKLVGATEWFVRGPFVIEGVMTGVIAASIALALLGIAAVVLIANTIRLSIFSRRREIEVMKLVGATNWFVRVPFVLEGMLTGFAGAAGAVTLLSIAYIGLTNLNGGLTDPARTFPAGVVGLGAALIAFGMFLGAFGSGLTLRKFLRI